MNVDKNSNNLIKKSENIQELYDQINIYEIENNLLFIKLINR